MHNDDNKQQTKIGDIDKIHDSLMSPDALEQLRPIYDIYWCS